MVNGRKYRSSGFTLVGLSLLIGGLTVFVSIQENPSKLASGLLQGMTIVLGTVGSFILGQDASRDAVKASLIPPARSAFRRVQNLYMGIGRQRRAAEDQLLRLSQLLEPDGKTIQFVHAQASLQLLEAIAVEQIGTADNALDDWRDLVPEEVEAIEKQAREREGM